VLDRIPFFARREHPAPPTPEPAYGK
jgi:hypothetical protein